MQSSLTSSKYYFGHRYGIWDYKLNKPFRVYHSRILKSRRSVIAIVQNSDIQLLLEEGLFVQIRKGVN